MSVYDKLFIINQPDGRKELVPSDETVKLLLDGLDKIGLTLPIS